MKIGLVCPYNIFRGGGVQEVVHAQYRHLSGRGHDVRIVTPMPREYTGKVPAHVITIGTSSDLKSPFHTTAQITSRIDNDEIDRMLDREQFDILHFHEPSVPLLSRQILTRSRTKHIATFHARLPDTMMSKTVERVITPYTRSVLKYIDCYTAVSDAGAEYVKTFNLKKPVHIIPNGIELSDFGRAAHSSKKPTILYIGRLEKRKGVQYLLRAVAEMQTRVDVGLVIAGDGPDMDKLQNQAVEYGVRDVEFLGYISDKDKYRLLGKATVFCSPARYGESFGIVLLEAMAAGVPVIAGDNDGYRTVMQDTGMLSLVDPQCTADFARRLEVFTRDNAVRALWKDWASGAIKQYDYSEIITQYEALYEQVLG